MFGYKFAVGLNEAAQMLGTKASLTQFIILVEAYNRREEGGVSMKEVREAFGFASVKTTHAVSTLMDKGFVTQTLDPSNKQVKVITLTEEGLRRMVELEKIFKG